MKKSISILLSMMTVISCLFSLTTSAAAEEDLRFSEEYKTSVYYANLMNALEEHKDSTTQERTLAVALSQEGYLNYATEGIDIEQAKADGKLWTGAELRMSSNETGNTEYTRWAQRYIMGRGEAAQYADYDWCAIFASWCMYQAGYYNEERLKKYYYAYAVDPRVFFDADSWIESFNLNQRMVYYSPKAHHKLDAMPWNTYYNVDIDPFDIPYKPGGLVFFSWDGTGQYFSHVGIVVSYDRDTRVLTYTNGNSAGQVITRQIDLDVEEEFRGQAYCLNADRILAYADYDTITPPAPKKITAETPVITWDKSASSGVKIQTNSESVMASVYLDDEYYGSIIESNMIFHEGLLTIGGSELRRMERGANKLTLAFDDGEVDLTVYITDTENEPMGKIGDINLDGTITIGDITLIQQYLADFEELSKAQRFLADIDEDGEITITDAAILQRWLAEFSEAERIGTIK